MSLNPYAPLFIPYQFQSLPLYYTAPPPPPQSHFPLTNFTFPPPHYFPVFQESLLNHPIYTQHPILTPDGYDHLIMIKTLPPPPPPMELFPEQIPNATTTTHFPNLLPRLPKAVAPPLPPPTGLLSQPPSPPPPPYSYPVVQEHTLATKSVKQALPPVTSGPRFDPKKRVMNPQFPRKSDGRWKRENVMPPVKRVVERNFGERKFAGSNYHARGNKKREKKEIIPLLEDVKTTSVMIKNIPNKYTRPMLMKILDKHCNLENREAKDLGVEDGEKHTSAYDFLYLPIDFNHRLNKGYAFVNFTDLKAVWNFYNAFNGNSWDLFFSPKVIEVVSAKIQGREALVSHFEESNFCCDSEEYLPVWFDPPRDGTGGLVKFNIVGNRHVPMTRRNWAYSVSKQINGGNCKS